VSEILRKKASQVPTFEDHGSFMTLSIVGPIFYCGNSSHFKWSAKVDLELN
jgi:hypothetical protein